MQNQHLDGSRIKIPLQLTDRNGKMFLVINLKAPRRAETVPLDKRRKVILHIFLNIQLVNGHAVDSIQGKPAQMLLLAGVEENADFVVCHF